MNFAAVQILGKNLVKVRRVFPSSLAAGKSYDIARRERNGAPDVITDQAEEARLFAHRTKRKKLAANPVKGTHLKQR